MHFVVPRKSSVRAAIMLSPLLREIRLLTSWVVPGGGDGVLLVEVTPIASRQPAGQFGCHPSACMG